MPYFNDGSLSREQLLKILSFSPVPTGIYAGEQVTIVAANEAMLNLWGKPKTVIGMQMQEALPELKSQPFIDILKEVIRTGIDYEAKDTAVELVVNNKLQTFYFDFVYKAVPMEDGSFHILNTAKDVTDRWHTTNTVDKLNSDLQELNKDLTIANEQYAEANKELTKAQNETEQQRKTLYDFIMQAPSGICVLKGENLVFELINPAYQQLLPARDLIGKPIFEALPELVGQPLEAVIRNIYTTGISTTFNELLVPIAVVSGGAPEDRYFNVTYQPSRTGDGLVDGVLAFVNEVTEYVHSRKGVVESEQHFRHLADLVPSKISNALPTGEVTFFNKQWLDFTGMNFEELRDFGYRKVLHPDDLQSQSERLQKYGEAAIPYSRELRIKNKEGEYIWHIATATPVLDENGKVKMWVGSSTDIQHLKLEEERKTDFVNMFSHELKTPITSIKGYVQYLLMLLQAGDDKPDKEFLNSSLARIDKLVKQLTALIEEMLDFGRIESGRHSIMRATVNLNELVHAMVNDASFINPHHQIRIQEDIYCTVLADADKIGQVLTNFISNAVKYAPDSRKIDIRIFQKDEKYAAVSVRDFGIGIATAEHKKIFDRFYRVEGKIENKIVGFGIGLFIAAAIVEQHEGYIEIDSEKGKGATFTFYIPLDRVLER
jgi:PAS domain S-box-containing protein